MERANQSVSASGRDPTRLHDERMMGSTRPSHRQRNDRSTSRERDGYSAGGRRGSNPDRDPDRWDGRSSSRRQDSPQRPYRRPTSTPSPPNGYRKDSYSFPKEFPIVLPSRRESRASNHSDDRGDGIWPAPPSAPRAMEPRPAVTSLPSNPSLPSKVPASPAMTDKTSKSNTPKLVKQLVPSNPSLVEKQIKNPYIDQLLFGDNGMAETNQQSSSSSSVEQAMSSAQQTKKEVDELVQQMKDVQALMDQLKARPPLRAGPGPSAPPVNQDPGPSGPAAGPSTKRKRKRSHDEPHVVKKIREEMAQVQSDVENTSVDVETYRADVMQQIEDLRIPRQTPPEAVQPIDVEKLKDDIKLVASSLHDQIVRVDDMSLARLHEINAGLSHRVAQLENRRAQREAKINTLLQAVEGLKSQSKPSTQELERLREETLQNVQMQVAEVLERGAKHVQTSLVKKQEELEGWLHNEHRGLQTFVSYLIQEATNSTPGRGKKRNRVESDQEASDDDDFGAGVASSSRPKRRAAVHNSAITAAEDDLDANEDSDYAERDNGSDEEPVLPNPNSSRKATAKSKPRQRIESDGESDADSSVAIDPEDSKPVQKLRGKGLMSAKGKSRDTSETKIQARDQRRLPDNRPTNVASPSFGAAEDNGPLNKKKKLPHVPKRSSAGGSGTPGPPLMKKSAARPTLANTLSGSKDLDLTNMDTIQSLFQTNRLNAANDSQNNPYEAMRIEARKARQAEAQKTFDLMAGSEKIRAFEAEMERMGVWPIPQVLAAPLIMRQHAQQ
ncbi:hypothetical protein FRB99_006204 [Tulasnella sp. 403]|nr:hypothetical protein FRB99_006204 [Tulasnella sp. 403]